MYDQHEYLEKIEAGIRRGPYRDTWESLSAHEVPKWFRDAKFGIFIHWGVYSVPAFCCEWYPRNMYMKERPEYAHHIATYGPHKEFGYKDFVPLFKAENFNPKAWADLFRAAGARYVVPVAEHHDGFQMYQSELSHWNAAEMGPKRDVFGELTQAIQANGLVSGASSHRIEHWFFMGKGRDFDSDVTGREQRGDLYWPAMPEADFQDVSSTPSPTEEFLNDWMIRTCEIINNYHPKELYFDWWIQHESARPYLKKIAAYYYNSAVARNEEVLICYKHDAFMFGTATVDIERGQFADIQPFAWQTDTAIAKNSWCYTEDNEFKKAKDIVCDLVDIVSKNGCLLLNVGPRADGTITEQDTDVLTEIGAWLKVNGEAIYGSRVWRRAAEGPTAVAEGQFTDAKDKVFTSQDFRFTVNHGKLYATCLAYPDNGRLVIRSLAKRDATNLPVFSGIIDDVEALGFDEKPSWHRDEHGLAIETKTIRSNMPVVFRITLR